MIVQANHGGCPKLYQLVILESKFMNHEIDDWKVQDYIVQKHTSTLFKCLMCYGLVRFPKNVVGQKTPSNAQQDTSRVLSNEVQKSLKGEDS